MPLHARTFTPVGATKGLDARVAVSMLVDQQGFLWVGAREGLFRYDGYSARAFLPEEGNPAAISDIDIRYVYQDSGGAIWVGTNTGGLNLLDRESGEFTYYRHDSTDPSSVAEDSIYGISEGPAGNLWVSTQKGLSRLNKASGEFEHFVHDPEDSTSIPHNWTYNLHLGSSNTLWISTIGGGVARWDPGSQNFIRYDLAALTAGAEGRNDTFTLYEDGDGVLWVGTREGLVRLDPAAGSAHLVDLGGLNESLPLITSMSVDNSGRIWLGTMVRGVLIVDPKTEHWEHASEQTLGAAGYLPAQPQMSLAISGDLLFVGTWGSGIYRAPITSIPFSLINKTKSANLKNNTISSIMPGPAAGQPWVGSFGGGPQLASIETAAVREVKQLSDSIHKSGVMQMARNPEGRLFAATTHGLYEFDEEGLQIKLFEHDPEAESGIGSGYIFSVLPADAGSLWVGTGGSGLQKLNLETGEFATFLHDAEQPDSLSGNFITSLLDGREGFLWVGTRSNGLNRCHIENWACERYSGRSGASDELSHYHVTSLFRDRRGRIWVTTDGGGINQVLQDEETGNVTGFRRWTRNHGLLNDGIMAVQEDLDESFWVSTRHGLGRFNPVTGDVVNFVSESGLPVSHFNTNASAADGEFIYFGSVDGLLSIRKGSLLTSREAAQVRITSIRHAAPGQVQADERTLDKHLSVPYGEVISIEMATLDYSESTHEYAYRLRMEDPWTALGSQRQIILHGLAPDNYAIQVRGRDVFGLWSESQPFQLDIIPPFWMTWWFRGLMIGLFAAMVLAWFFARERRLNHRADELRRLSERRENALEEKLGSQAELKVLTPRQKEILQLIAEGYTTKETADLLDVSVKTIEAHRANLMERLQIRDIAGLVKLAVRTGLVSPHE